MIKSNHFSCAVEAKKKSVTKSRCRRSLEVSFNHSLINLHKLRAEVQAVEIGLSLVS
jgi:hypothetical protein